MKKRITVMFLFVLVYAAGFAQPSLPRLAIVPFITNDDIYFKNWNPTILEDIALMRDMVWERIAENGGYEVVRQRGIDKMLEEQDIPVRLIASSEHIARLRDLNVNYLVIGTIAVSHSYRYQDYRLSLNFFDMASGRYIYRDYKDIMRTDSAVLCEAIRELIDIFIAHISASPVAENASDEREYKEGDFGPAGGIVFHDKGEYSDGWRYLERAPPETEFRAPWGNYEDTISGTKKEIGSGRENTRLIAEYYNKRGITGTAAQLCESLVCNGYDDWFLPSTKELDQVRSYLERRSSGRNNRIWYWSSTQSSTRFAEAQPDEFVYSSGVYVKNRENTVRAVRAF
ncbi:hypothetical protein FACS189491_06850 [Spirochaetia bacterium]|nr:hypothetical protein FACS189491_06850 [Spirochaetia bacterium]